MFRTLMATTVAIVMAATGIATAAEECPDQQAEVLAPSDPALTPVTKTRAGSVTRSYSHSSAAVVLACPV